MLMCSLRCSPNRRSPVVGSVARDANRAERCRIEPSHFDMPDKQSQHCGMSNELRHGETWLMPVTILKQAEQGSERPSHS